MKNIKELFYESYDEKNLISAKLNHYFEIYDELFKNYRDKKVKILEIGIRNGGSLYLWYKYFYNSELIVGIDIDEKCKNLKNKFKTDKIEIEIGDQANPSFLNYICEKYGKFDIIIDDGGHQFYQQINSLKNLFNFLNDEGLYIIEDTHTSYDNYAKIYPNDNVYDGGLKKSNTTIEFLKNFIDKLTRWAYLKEHGICPTREPKNKILKKFFLENNIKYDIFDESLFNINFYDSLCILKKKKKELPYIIFNNITGKDYNNNSNLFKDT